MFCFDVISQHQNLNEGKMKKTIFVIGAGKGLGFGVPYLIITT